MRDHLASRTLGSREQPFAVQLLREFRRVRDDDSIMGPLIFAAIGVLAGLVAAICGIPGIWI